MSEIRALREEHRRVGQRADEVTIDLLTHAYALYELGLVDDAAADAVRNEVKNLGKRVNRRSGLHHLAVLTAFPEIQPALKTRYAKAVRGGKFKQLSPDEFRKMLIEGPSSGKGGIKELARVCDTVAKDERASRRFAARGGDILRVRLNPDVRASIAQVRPKEGDELLVRFIEGEFRAFELISSSDKRGEQ